MNTKFEEMECVFNIIQKLVREHSEEILNVKCLEYSSPLWARSALSHDQAFKWAKAKECVYTDSYLCVGQMKDSPEAIERWRGQVEGLRLYSSYQDSGNRWRSNWIRVEEFSSIFSSLSILQEIQKDLTRKNIQPEEFKDRIIFMSMFIQWHWLKKEWWTLCFECRESQGLCDEMFARTLDIFLGLGSEEKWYVMFLTLSQENGTPKPTEWYSDSKNPVILCSKVSVPWQKWIELRGTGYFEKVQNPYCGDCHWPSAHPRGSTSFRLRSWSLRNRAITRGNACSPVAWQALRRPRILLWVGQRSKATIDQRCEECCLQDG